MDFHFNTKQEQCLKYPRTTLINFKNRGRGVSRGKGVFGANVPYVKPFPKIILDTPLPQSISHSNSQHANFISSQSNLNSISFFNYKSAKVIQQQQINLMTFQSFNLIYISSRITLPFNLKEPVARSEYWNSITVW